MSMNFPRVYYGMATNPFGGVPKIIAVGSGDASSKNNAEVLLQTGITKLIIKTIIWKVVIENSFSDAIAYAKN